MVRTVDPYAARRWPNLLLTAVVVLATALGLQVARPSPAAAATGPTVVDDGLWISAGTADYTLPGAANDPSGSAPLRVALTVFPADQLDELPAGSTITDDGKTVDLPDLAVLTIIDGGLITVHPRLGTGHVEVHYRITDTNGRSDEGLVVLTVTAGSRPDRVSAARGGSATVDLLANDLPGRDADGSPGTLDRTSVRFAEQQPVPVAVSPDGRTATYVGVGVFTIGATTGRLTFSPEPTYASAERGDRLDYTAQDTTVDADGNVQHDRYTGSVTWSVTPAARLAVTETAGPRSYDHVGDTVTWTTVVTNVGATPLSQLSLAHTLGVRLGGDVCAPVARGGTLAAGSSTTCTATMPVLQRDFDTDAARVDDVVTASGTTTGPTSAVTATGTSSARTVATIAQRLSMSASASRSSASAVGQRVDQSFVVRNRGNRSLRDLVVRSSSPGLTALVCAPVPLGGTLGEDATTTCRASRTISATDLGSTTLTTTAKATAVPGAGVYRQAANAAATLTTTVSTVSAGPAGPGGPAPAGPAPTSRPDSTTTAVGQPVVVDVLANDRPGSPAAPLVGSTVRLRLSAGLPAGSVLYGDAKTLKVAGRGVFLVSGTGQITFVPLGPTTGPVPTVGYQVAGTNGLTARSSLTVTVR